MELDTQFNFDLELPKSFIPTNNDGEVNEFVLVPVPQLIEMMCNFDVSLTSSPRIMDFLIRKGLLTFDLGTNSNILKEKLDFHFDFQSLIILRKVSD